MHNVDLYAPRTIGDRASRHLLLPNLCISLPRLRARRIKTGNNEYVLAWHQLPRRIPVVPLMYARSMQDDTAANTVQIMASPRRRHCLGYIAFAIISIPSRESVCSSRASDHRLQANVACSVSASIFLFPQPAHQFRPLL